MDFFQNCKVFKNNPDLNSRKCPLFGGSSNIEVKGDDANPSSGNDPSKTPETPDGNSPTPTADCKSKPRKRKSSRSCTCRKSKSRSKSRARTKGRNKSRCGTRRKSSARRRSASKRAAKRKKSRTSSRSRCRSTKRSKRSSRHQNKRKRSAFSKRRSAKRPKRACTCKKLKSRKHRGRSHSKRHQSTRGRSKVCHSGRSRFRRHSDDSHSSGSRSGSRHEICKIHGFRKKLPVFERGSKQSSSTRSRSGSDSKQMRRSRSLEHNRPKDSRQRKSKTGPNKCKACSRDRKTRFKHSQKSDGNAYKRTRNDLMHGDGNEWRNFDSNVAMKIRPNKCSILGSRAKSIKSKFEILRSKSRRRKSRSKSKYLKKKN